MPRRYILISAAPSEGRGGQVWLRCPVCGEASSSSALAAGAMVCSWCDFHFPLPAGARLDLLLDEGSFQLLTEVPGGASTPGQTSSKRTASAEGDAAPGAGPARFGWATIRGHRVAVALSDPATRWDTETARALATLAEEAGHRHRPILWVVTAGQEDDPQVSWPGLQAALQHVVEAGQPWITLLAGPCYGPAAALALQADLVLAEPGAVLAPVLPAALRQAGRLPLESTRPARELLRSGWADAVLSRSEQRAALAGLLDLLGVPGEEPSPASEPACSGPPRALPSPEPLVRLFPSFWELHGDRQSEDDPALVGGLAHLLPVGTRLLVLATAHGEGWAEVWRRHGGAIGAAGWRKATRLLRLAGRFGLPVAMVIDQPLLRTSRRDRPAEVAAALGETAQTLFSLPVPTLAICLAVGESLASQTLCGADCVLAREESALELRQRGFLLDGTFDDENMAAALSQQVAELTQTYTSHGALGRRALQQRRYIRWGRLTAQEGP